VKERLDQLARDWARVGVLFGAVPAEASPDLERLLIASAGAASANSRLLRAIVTWLAHYSEFVARHRLARLIATEASPLESAALGLALETAAKVGGTSALNEAIGACTPLKVARPLFDIESGALAELAYRRASEESKRWGVWAAPIEPALDTLRPAAWVLAHNPTYRDRIVRKGDLRCSIIESLRHDAPRGVRSEAELARLAGATRAAVRKALESLVLEGDVRVFERNARDRGVELRGAA